MDIVLEDLKQRYPSLYVVPLLEASLSFLRTNHPPIDSAIELEKQLVRLIEGSFEPVVLLVGSAIHWYTILVRRLCMNDGPISYQIAVIDSQNHATLHASEQDMLTIAQDLPFTTWLRAGWPKDMLVQLAMDSFRGMNYIVDLIKRRLSGVRHLSLDCTYRMKQAMRSRNVKILYGSLFGTT